MNDLVWYALGAVLVYAVLSGIENTVQTRRRRRERNAVCPGAPTLLVVMYSRFDNYAAAATLRGMAVAALCPQRIRVAVVQAVKDTSIDVFDLYEEAGGGFENADAIRVLTVRDNDALSTLAAYDLALDKLYRDETFVLFTTPGTVFARHFDTVLTAQMDGWNKKNALVNHGPKFLQARRMHPPSSKSMRHYYSTTFPADPPPPDATLWYPTFHTTPDNATLPSVVPAAGPLTTKKTMVQSLAASTVCTLVRAPVPVLDIVGGDAADGDSFLLSAALHAHGYTFSAVPTTVCFERSTTRKPVKESMPDAPPTVYMHFAGIDPANYALYGRARLGLVTLGEEEILAKFGSNVAFQREKNSL